MHKFIPKKTRELIISHPEMLEMEKKFLFFRLCKFLAEI